MSPSDKLDLGGLFMNSPNDNNELENQSPILPSLRLRLLSTLVGLSADVILLLSVLASIDEVVVADEKAKQDQKELDERLTKMQKQIDQLTKELIKIKSASKNNLL